MNRSYNNTSSIDALAEVALSQKLPSSLSCSPSSSSLFDSQTDISSMKLASAPSKSNLMASMARSGTLSMPMMNSMPMMTQGQGLPCVSGSGKSVHSIYLSILNEQRRRSIDSNPSSNVSQASGSMPMSMPSATGILGSNPTVEPGNNHVQAQASGVSDASNYASMMQNQFDSTITAPSRRRKPNFAEKLHAVLNSKDSRSAIAWLPSGRSFCITDQDEFVKKVLPEFFREAKFESFSRRLKRWGFRKVYTTGMSQIIFSHDLFHRDRPDLCKIMNGREKIVSSSGHTDCTSQDMAVSGGVDPFASQNQFRSAMMFHQARAQQQQQQATFQAMQHMNQNRASFTQSIQPASVVSGGGSPRNSFLSQSSLPLSVRGTSTSPAGSLSGISMDARAILNEASALASRSMPTVTNDPQALVNANDPSLIQEAQIQLTKLNGDIANCEEQLLILQQLKDLKERRRMLTGGSISPRGNFPSSA